MIVVVGIVLAHVEVRVDLHHGHVVGRTTHGMGPQRPDRDRVDPAQEDHEGIASQHGIGDPPDHELRRQVADLLEHPMRDRVPLRRLGPGMALQQLDLLIEASHDRRRSCSRAGAERRAMLIGHADQDGVGILHRRAVDDRVGHQLSSSLASWRLGRRFQLPLW